MSDAPLNLKEQQAKNRHQTIAWMTAFVLFFAWLGFGGDLAAYFLTMDAQGHSQHTVWWGGFRRSSSRWARACTGLTVFPAPQY